jgi:phenylacetic acid degradation operon negative regulatory protein
MLGIDDHLARTSALRLVYDGWLSNNRSGRVSFYSMSENYAKTYLDFQSRVYSDPAQLRQKEWLLLMLIGNFTNRKERNSIINELIWYGFGPVEPRLFLHASLSHEAAQRILARTSGGQRAILAQFGYGSVHWETLAKLVSETWDLKQVIHDYHEFIDNFTGIQQWLRRNGDHATPAEALAIRLLLIHEYRRIALRDPHLPKELTGLAWPGEDAFTLMRTLYAATFSASEAYLDQVLTSLNSSAQAREAAMVQRFGGWWPGGEPAASTRATGGHRSGMNEGRRPRRPRALAPR